MARLQAADLDIRDVVDGPSRDAYAASRDRASLLRWTAVGCAAAAGGFAAYGIVWALRTPSAVVRVVPLLGATSGVGFVGEF